MKRYTLDLSEDLHKRLKVRCAMQGLDMAEVIRKLIEEYLDKIEKKKTKQQA